MKKKEIKNVKNKQVSRFPNRDMKTANRNSLHHEVINTTVFLTIKPFIKGTFLFAEGRFSESQPVRSWMMIRIYNN